jgi:tetratricopeptide (TPR) repeat protein
MAKANQKGRQEPELFDELLGKTVAFLKKNALHILLAGGLIAVGMMVYRTLVLRGEAARVNQWSAVTLYPEITVFMAEPGAAVGLHEQTLRDCRQLLAESAETAATPWLLLKIGNLHATGSQWEKAEETYRRIGEEYPESGAAEAALPARAVALEQLGRYDEAAALYRGLQHKDPDHLLAAGRCLELGGRREQARETYRRLLRSQAPERLRQMAEFRLGKLQEGKQLEAPPQLETLLSVTAKARAGAAQREVPADTSLQAAPVPSATPLQEAPAVPAATPLLTAPPPGSEARGTD